MARFIIHEHHSKKLHWDLRLEVEGVLKSWALPKGPTRDPQEKHLALEVPDHTLAYGDYEGIIPEGSYGAGAVLIWDQGKFESLDPDSAAAGLKKGSLKFRLEGKILKGDFVLVKMRGPGREKAWLLIKKTDEFAETKWKPPVRLTPERQKQLKVKPPPCSVEE